MDQVRDRTLKNGIRKNPGNGTNGRDDATRRGNSGIATVRRYTVISTMPKSELSRKVTVVTSTSNSKEGFSQEQAAVHEKNRIKMGQCRR